MRTFLIALLLSLPAIGAKAALFITNNTNCSVTVTIYAHDQNHSVCGLESGRLQLAAGESAAFNNVATLNTTLPGWQNGQMATTAGGAAVWGWDGAFVTNGSILWAQIGRTGSCFPIPVLVTPNACGTSSVTTAWQAVGGNAFLDII